MRARWYITWVLASAAAFAARADDAQFVHHDRGPLARGDAAPAFGPVPVLNAKGAGAKTLSFSGHPSGSEHVWVLAFFAEWCPGCVNELPMLQHLDKDYRTRGVRIVSISVDARPGAPDRVRDLLAKDGVVHPVLMDPEEKVLHLYEGMTHSLPYLFVIGADGKIAQTHEGFDAGTEDDLRGTIENLLPRRP